MNSFGPNRSLGAIIHERSTTFRVWAPRPERLELVIRDNGADRVIEMPVPDADGYRERTLAGVGAGARYGYRADGNGPFPDPCSRRQPDGIHGLSEVVDPSTFTWSDDAWAPPPFADLVIYECHVGTFTPEGTFASAVARLPDLIDLGINVVQVMPVAAFSGRWNWGYDGVQLFAPAEPYGGPDAFRAFVDEAHGLGIAVILDVVYNHFGPSGNYTGVYSEHYTTPRYQTPWGDAINFDGPGSEGVRRFFAENLLHWQHEYHVDGFRFDATHAIFDSSEVHVLAELSAVVDAHRRTEAEPYLIAESHENDVRYVSPRPEGYGFDAVWSDDFHHAVRTLLTGEHEGYLSGFDGSISELAATVEQGFLYEGQIDPNTRKPRGGPARECPWTSFQFCTQNHDQVGNRAYGQRLNVTASLADFLAASALLLLLPQTPLLFQGQEFLASTPFLYFTDHDEALGRLVTEGRRHEFAAFTAYSGAAGKLVPDPQDPASFTRSKLDWAEAHTGLGLLSRNLHRDLIALRQSDPVLSLYRRERRPIRTSTVDLALIATFEGEGGERRWLITNFGQAARIPPVDGKRAFVLATNAYDYGGNGIEPEILEGGELIVPAHTTVLLRSTP